MSFSYHTDILQIVPVVSLLSLPHYEPSKGETPPPHQIKSDYIVSLMEQFVSQFCQHLASTGLPGEQCVQASEPSGIIYFTQDAL